MRDSSDAERRAAAEWWAAKLEDLGGARSERESFAAYVLQSDEIRWIVNLWKVDLSKKKRKRRISLCLKP